MPSYILQGTGNPVWNLVFDDLSEKLSPRTRPSKVLWLQDPIPSFIHSCWWTSSSLYHAYHSISYLNLPEHSRIFQQNSLLDKEWAIDRILPNARYSHCIITEFAFLISLKTSLCKKVSIVVLLCQDWPPLAKILPRAGYMALLMGFYIFCRQLWEWWKRKENKGTVMGFLNWILHHNRLRYTLRQNGHSMRLCGGNGVLVAVSLCGGYILF